MEFSGKQSERVDTIVTRMQVRHLELRQVVEQDFAQYV